MPMLSGRHAAIQGPPSKGRLEQLRQALSTNYALYLLLVPVFVYYIVFSYVPMYGVTLAFKEFDPIKGIFGNDWVGFHYFQQFFATYQFKQLLTNTFLMSFLSLLFGFPVAVLLALMLNEVRMKKYKKFIQTVTYAPHFISTVVFVGMVISFLNPRTGIINNFLALVGLDRIHFMQESRFFIPTYIVSGIWQEMGWGSIVFIAALSTVDPELYEAGYVDGMNILQKIWHIDLPCIRPTLTIMMILSMGNVLNVGFEKVFLMQNTMNISSSQVISTYVYNVGLLSNQFSYATAIGLFNSLINFVLLAIVNLAARRMGESTLW
jgi:putative aldouronate transport system permease protein